MLSDEDQALASHRYNSLVRGDLVLFEVTVYFADGRKETVTCQYPEIVAFFLEQVYGKTVTGWDARRK